MNDSNDIFKLYEEMHGSKNTESQVNEAVTNHVKATRPKRRRRRSQKATGDKQILEQTNNGQQSDCAISAKEPKTGEINIMNKFDELYNNAINEQLDADIDFEAPADAEMDADVFGGEEEDTEVTITLDRDIAQKLCEVIQAAVGDGEEDEMGGEGEETDDFGDENGFAGDVEEEGAGEDSLSTAPDGVSKMTKGSLSAGATQNIGDQTHQSNRGAAAAKKPQTPKPLTHKTS